MRWEYCAVVGVSRKQTQIANSSRDMGGYYSAVWYFNSGGYTKQEIHGNEAIELGRVIAWLGDQGWEMVGVGGLNGDTLYFKRPKP